MKNRFKFIISIILPQLAGAAGAVFTTRAIEDWYQYLLKPAFAPPNWLFGPVWVTLYLMMGVSVYLVWCKADEKKEARELVWLFWVHLVFNALWSPIFFGMRDPGLGFVWIVMIWLMVVAMTVKFYPVSKWAGILLVPYFLWVSFASALNYFIWVLN